MKLNDMVLILAREREAANKAQIVARIKELIGIELSEVFSRAVYIADLLKRLGEPFNLKEMLSEDCFHGLVHEEFEVQLFKASSRKILNLPKPSNVKRNPLLDKKIAFVCLDTARTWTGKGRPPKWINDASVVKVPK